MANAAAVKGEQEFLHIGDLVSLKDDLGGVVTSQGFSDTQVSLEPDDEGRQPIPREAIFLVRPQQNYSVERQLKNTWSEKCQAAGPHPLHTRGHGPPRSQSTHSGHRYSATQLPSPNGCPMYVFPSAQVQSTTLVRPALAARLYATAAPWLPWHSRCRSCTEPLTHAMLEASS